MGKKIYNKLVGVPTKDQEVVGGNIMLEGKIFSITDPDIYTCSITGFKFNKQHTNLTISDLVTQEKQYMKDTINKDIQIYFAGRYVKTKGSYRNIEERCNAVLQPLNFYIYKID